MLIIDLSCLNSNYGGGLRSFSLDLSSAITSEREKHNKPIILGSKQLKNSIKNYPELINLEWFEYDERINPLLIRFTKLPLLLNIDKLKIIFNSFLDPYDAVINLEVGNKFISLAKYTKSKIKVGLPHKYVAENIKNEHRVHHQLRILQSAFKDIKIENAYPYLVGSKIDIKKYIKLNENIL